MGVRKIIFVEPIDSKIKWIKADEELARKIILASDGNLPSLIFLILHSLVILFVALGFLFILSQISLAIIIKSIISILWLSLVFIFFLLPVIRRINLHFYGKDVWYFKAKCQDSSDYHTGSDDQYKAYFQKGGMFIGIRISTSIASKKSADGQEFIFYKFKDKTGEEFKAIMSNKIEE